ncbi:hypothetical protein ABH930_006731 [Kitasatospora sp. GAS204A]|uniref:hypothetical protein n=1 Tax=unclassified Kitasatospora TaxID=2633591 RepID=UPI002472F1AE|nr:hypothetical protein [Kitasatospora sp. GAS204B]MDH6122384.1 hypothetical protein [Kitasatospora sp. GAS204B]
MTLRPWEEISEHSRWTLAEYPGIRLQRIMYGGYEGEMGAVPADAFALDCAASDVRLEALRAADRDDAGVVFADLSFGAVVAPGTSADRRARAEYYLCDALIEYANRHDVGYWAPAIDPSFPGRYRPEETGPAPVDSFTAAIIARGVELGERMDHRTDEGS